MDNIIKTHPLDLLSFPSSFFHYLSFSFYSKNWKKLSTGVLETPLKSVSIYGVRAFVWTILHSVFFYFLNVRKEPKRHKKKIKNLIEGVGKHAVQFSEPCHMLTEQSLPISPLTAIKKSQCE